MRPIKITPSDHQDPKDTHRFMIPKFMELLRPLDDKTDEPRQIEFFFFADTEEKANRLKNDLEKLGYEVYQHFTYKRRTDQRFWANQ